jgi:hypothetical protein
MSEHPRPTAVRVAVALMGVMAALTALGTAGTVATVASAVLLDPTLLRGQVGLALSVSAVLGAVGSIATLLLALGAGALARGRPVGRAIGTVLGVLWLGSPLLPVGAGLLWLLWGDEEARGWLDDVQAARAAKAAEVETDAAVAGEANAEAADPDAADVADVVEEPEIEEPAPV